MNEHDQTPADGADPDQLDELDLIDPAAAVADDTVHGRPTARQRLQRAMLRPGPGQVTAAVLLAVLGAAAVTQVRLAGTDDDYAGMRQADLVQALNGLQASSQRTEQDIRDLEDTRDALRSDADKRAAALDKARGDLASLGVLAGTVPATGQGVRITVDVPDSRISLNYLLDGIEELRDAGAEAMEINDSVRIVAQSSFETADGGVNVDGRVLTAPFVIDAIGDPESLATALRFPGGFVDDIALDEGKVTIKKSPAVKVSSLRTPTEPRFARPSD
ncbi:DUF881 domain-containing protein [Marmoricola sp. RAF53]|uniref:DUF881 domain-containing protein n=1 Tax=Marmoricola sp. RAF53 TaxID=3233059 RepID=UPI003F9DC20D